MHPESLEIDMKLLPYVANAFVYGDGKEYNVAIIVPDFTTIGKDHHTAQWSGMSTAQIIADKGFEEFIIKEVNDHLRRSFAGYEIPKKYIIIDQDFTLENGMLTQTLKVIRGEVMKKYGDALNRLYAE